MPDNYKYCDSDWMPKVDNPFSDGNRRVFALKMHQNTLLAAGILLEVRLFCFVMLMTKALAGSRRTRHRSGHCRQGVD